MVATDLAVIFFVLSVLVSVLAGLVLAVTKYSKKVTKMPGNVTADLVYNRQMLEDPLNTPGDYRDGGPYLPSCPPLAPLPPPPLYTALDNPQTNPTPSYPAQHSLLLKY